MSRNKLLPYPKNAKNLQVPKLTIKRIVECVQEEDKGTPPPFKRVFDLTLETDAVALYVWLETEGKIRLLHENQAPTQKNLFLAGIEGHFDDNGFLMDTKITTVRFFAVSPADVTPQQLQDSLKLKFYRKY